MTSSIARMNCFLHGIEDFRIERGNTLAVRPRPGAEPLLQLGNRSLRCHLPHSEAAEGDNPLH